MGGSESGEGQKPKGWKQERKFSICEERMHSLDGLIKYQSQWLKEDTGFWFGEVRRHCLLSALHHPTLAEPTHTPFSVGCFPSHRDPKRKG